MLRRVGAEVLSSLRALHRPGAPRARRLGTAAPVGNARHRRRALSGAAAAGWWLWIIRGDARNMARGLDGQRGAARDKQHVQVWRVQ